MHAPLQGIVRLEGPIDSAQEIFDTLIRIREIFDTCENLNDLDSEDLVNMRNIVVDLAAQIKYAMDDVKEK